MNLDRLGLPHLLCCGVSTRRESRHYRCGKCKRYYKLDGTRILKSVKRERPPREEPIISYVDLAVASDDVMIHYATLSMARRFKNQARHMAQGIASRALCNQIASRYLAIIERHKK